MHNNHLHSLRDIASNIAIKHLKVGDIVKVVDISGLFSQELILGNEYEILEIIDSIQVRISNNLYMEWSYYANRFEKVTKEKK